MEHKTKAMGLEGHQTSFFQAAAASGASVTPAEQDSHSSMLVLHAPFAHPTGLLLLL